MTDSVPKAPRMSPEAVLTLTHTNKHATHRHIHTIYSNSYKKAHTYNGSHSTSVRFLSNNNLEKMLLAQGCPLHGRLETRTSLFCDSPLPLGSPSCVHPRKQREREQERRHNCSHTLFPTWQHPHALQELSLSRGLNGVQGKLICGIQHLPSQNPCTVYY